MPRAIPAKEALECWDDDEDFAGVGNIGLRSSGIRNIQITETSSSRSSLSSSGGGTGSGSGFDSDDGYDQQFLLPPDAESSEQAIRSAIAAGIPIPKNVPASALLGGSIKKLGTRRRRSPIPGDWGDELELPTTLPMKLRTEGLTRFPSSLSDQSSGHPNSQPTDDGDDVPTIRVSKRVTPKATLIGAFEKPPSPELKRKPQLPSNREDDDFEDDFDFGDDSDGLQLAAKNVFEPRTPVSMSFNDSDADEWGEGSLGVRHGGQRNRSGSLASLLSPSASSTLTFDSEDELAGLDVPDSTFDFRDALEHKQQFLLAQAAAQPRKSRSREEFLEGLEFGDGDLFNAGSLRNRNLKHTHTRPMSPAKRNAAMTLTFSQQGALTSPSRHGRRLSVTKAPKLDTLVEVQGKVQDLRKTRQQDPSPTRSRRGNNENQRLVSQPMLAPAGNLPANDRQKSLKTQKSTPNLKNPNNSPIKLRQPMAPPLPTALRQPLQRPTSRTGFIPQPRPSSRSSLGGSALVTNMPRPSSRTDISRLPQMRPASRSSLGRPQSRTGARSPSIDRLQASSRQSNHRPPSRTSSRLSSHSRTEDRSKSPRRPGTPLDHNHPPFLPAGSSLAQSHHVTSKLSRQSSDKALNGKGSSENIKKPSVAPGKKSSPYKPKNTTAPEALQKSAATVVVLRQPARKMQYGNGNELQNFDDLPTISRGGSNGAPRGLTRSNSKITSQAKNFPPPDVRLDQSATGLPDMSPITHVSRAPASPRIEHLTSLQDSRLPRRKPGSSRPQQHSSQRPKLIRPEAAGIPGGQDMHYNHRTFRWEGNESEVKSFEQESTGLPTQVPRPALIASIKSAQNVQVVGNMVFDPTHMCWLKVDNNVTSDDEDVFASIDDLDVDGTSTSPESSALTGSMRLNDIIAEEFDVGPRFVQTQKAEEERWHAKVHPGWFSEAHEARDSSKSWDLRKLALTGGGPSAPE